MAILKGEDGNFYDVPDADLTDREVSPDSAPAGLRDDSFGQPIGPPSGGGGDASGLVQIIINAPSGGGGGQDSGPPEGSSEEPEVGGRTWCNGGWANWANWNNWRNWRNCNW